MKEILILGAKGMLGGELMKIFPGAIGWDRADADVLDFEGLKAKILALKFQPEAIINCVAYNDVDGAENNQRDSFALNAEFVGKLAAFTKILGVPLVHFSTNYVFDGEKEGYEESDVPRPLSVYGQSKYQGEKLLQENTDEYYLIRTAVLFGPKGRSSASKKSFVELMLDLSAKSDTIKAVDDVINSITLASDLAQAVKYLVTEHKPFGIYHIANEGAASWHDIAREIFSILNRKTDLAAVKAAEFPRQAARPKRGVLINTKMYKLQPWPEALREYLVKEYLTKNPV